MTMLCLSYTLPMSIQLWKGKIPILIPWVIPARQKRHPRNSVFLSLHSPGSPGAVRRPQPHRNLTLYKLFTDILSRCTRCECGYRLWDCLPHPPFCITLSQTVYGNQITMVLRSQPAQPCTLHHTRAGGRSMCTILAANHTRAAAINYLPYLIFCWSKLHWIFFFLFTPFKANTQMTGCCWRKIWAFISYYY